MNDPLEEYKSKLQPAERAMSQIRSGQKVFVGSNCAEPQTLVDALTSRADHLADTEIVHILTLGTAPYSAARFQNHFRSNAFFIGANVRDAINECRADYTPIFLSEVPELFRSGQIPLDYALIQVSPPDKHGYCSLGVSIDVVKAAAESARFVIAEANRRVPRTHGNSFLHVNEVDVFVESDLPLLEMTPPPPTDVTQRIGKHVAGLIEDGSTLQMGIGGIPDAVLSYLAHKQDLGVHTEMFSDGIMPLIEAGVVTNARKSIHTGKIVASFCMGTRALYDFVDDNPSIEFHPTEYVNDPFVISQNARMVAINAAIEVDLTGQVCADSIGERFYSGIGGQVDFLRGAARSRGGKAVIALPSTAALRDGTVVSRIVSTLKPGAGVVTSRGDVHYVVTEWGTAYLHGKSIRERAMALVSIAHPDFRAELLAAARERKLVMADIAPETLVPRYPEEYEEKIKLKDGTDALLRPIRPTDEDLLQEFHYRLSPDTIYHRYHHAKKALPHAERLKLVSVDYRKHFALVAVQQQDRREELLGVGRYYVDEQTNMGELAFTVRDDWQEKGIGTAIMKKLLQVGKEKRLAGFDAYVESGNARMVDLLRRFDFTELPHGADEPLHMELRFRGGSGA